MTLPRGYKFDEFALCNSVLPGNTSKFLNSIVALTATSICVVPLIRV